jgi:hypothetical protein
MIETVTACANCWTRITYAEDAELCCDGRRLVNAPLCSWCGLYFFDDGLESAEVMAASCCLENGNLPTIDRGGPSNSKKAADQPQGPNHQLELNLD